MKLHISAVCTEPLLCIALSRPLYLVAVQLVLVGLEERDINKGFSPPGPPH